MEIIDVDEFEKLSFEEQRKCLAYVMTLLPIEKQKVMLDVIQDMLEDMLDEKEP